MGSRRFFIVVTLVIFFSVSSHPVAAGGTGNISVQVTNANGAPLENLYVFFYKDGVRVAQVQTGADGKANAIVAPGTYTLDAHGTTVYTKSGIVVTEGKVTSADFNFGLIAVQATSADGAPMQNTWIYFYKDGQRKAQVQTDSNGQYNANVAPGTYTLDVYGTTIYTMGMTVAEGQLVPADFNFGLIAVQATSADGAPMRNTWIYFYKDGQRKAQVQTDSNGQYNANVAPGTYTLDVYGTTIYTKSVDVLPGEIEYVIFGPPDLSISSSDITFSNENPMEGELINISAIIHNGGDADISGTTVDFYDGDPVNGILISTANTGTIAVAGSETIKIPWNVTPAGLHEIHVVVDPGDVIYEISEDNNHAWAEVNVTASNVAPVAYIDSITPSPAVEGEEATFTGHGTDEDGSVIAYEWRSSIDGFLSSQASFSTSSLSLGNHMVYFRVQDDGEEWGEEASVGLEVVTDTEPPTIVIISPLETIVISSPISISGRAFDNVAVDKVELSVNDGPFELATGISPWTYSSSLRKGTNTISIKATDKAGNPAETTVDVHYLPIGDYTPYYFFSEQERYYPTSFYFDNDINTENNKESYNAGIGIWYRQHIYVNTVEDETYFTIQYWLYYADNPWGRPLLNHEHDWESQYIVFDKSDLSEPVEVRYAHHDSVKPVPWDNVERIGNHPEVLVARSSHASYPSYFAIEFSLAPEIWIPGSLITLDNLILVHEGPHYDIVLPTFPRDNTYCHSINFETIKGVSQPEPMEGYWPKFYLGERGLWHRAHNTIYEAPWHRESWDLTRPNPPEYADLRELLNNTFVLGAMGPVDLHLYDSSGQHVGINYVTGEPEIHIPNALFYSDEEGQLIEITKGIEGSYRIEIVGTGNSSYDFATFRTVEGAYVFIESNFSTS